MSNKKISKIVFEEGTQPKNIGKAEKDEVKSTSPTQPNPKELPPKKKK